MLAAQRGRAGDPVTFGQHTHNFGMRVLADHSDQGFAVTLGHRIVGFDFLFAIDARLKPTKGRVLATRLYLLDDPRNERDWHFAALGPSRQAAVMLDPIQRADGAFEAGFNFVI